MQFYTITINKKILTKHLKVLFLKGLKRFIGQ